MRWQIAGSAYASTGAVAYDVEPGGLLAALGSVDGDLWIAEGEF